MKWSPCTQRLHFVLSLESDQYLSWVPNKGRGYILHSVHLSYQVPHAVIINLVRTNLSHEIVLYLFCCLAKYYKFSCRKSMCSQLCRSKAQVNPSGVLLRVSQGWNQNLHWLDSQLEAWGKEAFSPMLLRLWVWGHWLSHFLCWLPSGPVLYSRRPPTSALTGPLHLQPNNVT